MFADIQILESILLVFALSIDAFVASFAYGTGKIKMPFNTVVIISAICSVMLGASVYIGYIIRPLIPGEIISIVCFMILLTIGIISLCDSSIKAYIRKRRSLDKEIAFSAMNLKFILHIYADPQAADVDESRALSAKEAVSLSVALSLDGLAAGFGAGFSSINPIGIIIISFVSGIMAVLSGSFAGNKTARKTSLNLSWVSGALLIMLAVSKLI